ncbi:peptidase [Acaryochloris sp. IP29b_bin.148]|uniref:peptidase n=1 Tax=Acaryochloris sp. IP29b_bin.148 TaxID=2969218 RepID=UPI00262E68B7|nr:peptidase [Acaryochloris sp. IP29b_bin.148]
MRWPSLRKWPAVIGLGLLGLLAAIVIHLGWADSSRAALQAPDAQVHLLPAALAQWQDPQQQGDYFDQIKVTRVGYLIWSQFPVKVYAQPAPESLPLIQEKWPQAVDQAIQAWQAYFPLEVTTDPNQANISISAVDPTQRSQGRIRSAETRFKLYVDDQQRLAHRFTIQVRANQTETYIAAAVRHELGHALGIWGHSQLKTDALYFSQVRTPPPISARDMNTLKRVYQQPTRLGWPVQSSDAAP